MTCRIRFLACHRRGPFQLCQSAAYLLLVVTLLASNNLVNAAPVTLAFDAQIDAVPPGIPFDSGLDYQVGDIVKGRFTFDPQVGMDNMYLLAPQSHAARARDQWNSLHNARFSDRIGEQFTDKRF